MRGHPAGGSGGSLGPRMRTSAATALALLRGYLPDAACERVDARVGSNRARPRDEPAMDPRRNDNSPGRPPTWQAIA